MVIRGKERSSTSNISTHAKLDSVSVVLTGLYILMNIRTVLLVYLFLFPNSGEWSKFTPKSNAYWMHYIVNRMAIKSKVKNLTRRHIYSALRLYLSSFPEYDSAKQIFLDLFSKPPPSISSKKFM